MIERPDNPSRQITPDARPKKQWVEPEIEVLPASETDGIAQPLGGTDFGSNLIS
jgi:hypothetical protein